MKKYGGLPEEFHHWASLLIQTIASSLNLGCASIRKFKNQPWKTINVLTYYKPHCHTNLGNMYTKYHSYDIPDTSMSVEATDMAIQEPKDFYPKIFPLTLKVQRFVTRCLFLSEVVSCVLAKLAFPASGAYPNKKSSNKRLSTDFS